MTLDGNRKLIVSAIGLLVVGAVAIWGPLTSDEVSAMLKWAIPTIVGAFTAANVVEHKLKKDTNGNPG